VVWCGLVTGHFVIPPNMEQYSKERLFRLLKHWSDPDRDKLSTQVRLIKLIVMRLCPGVETVGASGRQWTSSSKEEMLEAAQRVLELDEYSLEDRCYELWDLCNSFVDE
jgi:hypothetical protein